jgi:WD40 repeat protein
MYCLISHLMSECDEQTIERLKMKKTRCIPLTLRGHTNTVWAVAFSSDGATLASASSDRTVKLWEVQSGCELQTLEGHNQAITAVAVSPDCATIASASNDGIIKL